MAAQEIKMTLLDRKKLLDEIPNIDLQKWIESEMIAIDVEKKQVFDADNDYVALRKRVDQLDVRFITARNRLYLNSLGHADRVTKDRSDKSPPQVGG